MMEPHILRECPCCDERVPTLKAGSRTHPESKKIIRGYYVWCSSCGLSTSLQTYDPIISSGEELAKDKARNDWNRRGGVSVGTVQNPTPVIVKTVADMIKAIRLRVPAQLNKVSWAPSSYQNTPILGPGGEFNINIFSVIPYRRPNVEALFKTIVNHDCVNLTLMPIGDTLEFELIDISNALPVEYN